MMQTRGEGLVLSEAPMQGEAIPQSETLLVPGPGGMDVHGDGFDEIIPSAPSAPAPKMAGVQRAEVPDIISASPVVAGESAAGSPIPERELSQDEIEKLLSGSTPTAGGIRIFCGFPSPNLSRREREYAGCGPAYARGLYSSPLGRG